MVAAMGDKHVDFFTAETLLNSIAWQVEGGHAPLQCDIEQLIRYYRSGEISVKRRRGAPSKIIDHIRWAKMVVRERHKGISRAAALERVGQQEKKDPIKTIEPIYDKHRPHAEELVKQEDIVACIEKLVKTMPYDKAIADVVAESGMTKSEVRFLHQHWMQNFPSYVRELSQSIE